MHALLGENGAGKSTLVKIIAGALAPDSGTVELDGLAVRFSSTAEAVRAGIAVVSQELNLFRDLDVLSNLYPMRELKRGPFVDRAAMAERARPVLTDLGLHVSLRTPVADLSLAERQLLEIAKALLTSPRVLILDEPTSALGATSTAMLLDTLRVLRDRQVGVVFVSHILEDVMALCDEITVLRDGQVGMSARPRAELTVPAIVSAMLGDAPETVPPVRVKDSIEVERGGLELRGVAVDGRLEELELSVARGEVVGLAGVAGAGHHTVLELVSGLRRADRGTVVLPSGATVPHGLRNAIRAGVALVTGDRRRLGLMLDKPIWENIGQIRSVGLAADGPLVRSRVLRRRASRAGARAADPLALGRSARGLAVGRQPAEGRLRQVAGRGAVGRAARRPDARRRRRRQGRDARADPLDGRRGRAGADLLDRHRRAGVAVRPRRGSAPRPRVGGAGRWRPAHPRGAGGDESGVERVVLSDDDLEQQRAGPVLEVGQGVVERR